MPGSLDASLGEFWVENPWQIVSEGHNLSCFERNRIYLNSKGKDFLEISHLSGADNDGDSRSIVAADFRNNGMLDLVLRQCGGGPLLLYENRLKPKNYLRVSLKGVQSNRQGIGARLVATVGDRKIVRELFPANGFCCQGPCEVHFGLGDSQTISSLDIQWPSGAKQIVRDIAANRHIEIEEENPEVLEIVPK